MASEELDQVIQALGIDVNSLGGGGGGTWADPTDPPVYIGRTFTGDGTDRSANAAEKRMQTGWEGGTRPLSQVELDLYRKSPSDVAILQQRLYLGGFYGNMDPRDIRVGDYDEATASAWSRAAGRASAFYQAGRKITVDDVIEEAARNGLASGRAMDAGSRRKVALSNPADMQAIADQVGSRVLGRKAKANEIERIVKTIHEYERSYGNVEEGTVVAPPDPSVVADRVLRESAGGEANQMATSTAINAVIDLLAGGE